jgi:imidazolonepropionase-like amidohydrolase
MRNLVEAGETPEQLFRSATLANAESFGLSSEVGTVQAGKRANLLLLRGDPTRSIDAYEHIEKIILHGKVLEPRDLAADRPK